MRHVETGPDSNGWQAGTPQSETIDVVATTEDINAGPGNDRVEINTSEVNGLTIIDGGSGNDTLALENKIGTWNFQGETVSSFNTLQFINGGNNSYHRTAIFYANQMEQFSLFDFDSSSQDEETVLVYMFNQSTLNLSSDTVTDFTSGNDLFRILGDSSAENITGTVADDSISGALGNDTLNGWNGDDTILGGGGTDAMFGGIGNDMLDLSGEGVSVINVNLGTNFISTADTINSFENVVGTSGNDTITGSTVANLLDGGSGNGNDIFRGGDGVDTILAGGGDDVINIFRSDLHDTTEVIDGGTGNDFIQVIDDGVGATTFDLNLELNTITSIETVDFDAEVDDTTIVRITSDQLGTGFSNTLRLVGDGSSVESFFVVREAGAGDQVIDLSGFTFTNWFGNLSGGDIVFIDANTSGTGNDTLTGTSNVDWISAEAGDDSVLAGGGDDRVEGDNGNDSLFGEAGNDSMFGGSGNDSMFGGSGNDTLRGNNDDDLVDGDAGDDSLFGDSGDDTIVGGTGNDDMDGGTGTDWGTFLSSGTGIIADMFVETWRYAASATLNDFIDMENVTGSNSADEIDGNAEANHLIGLGGADTISGAGNDDTLNGDAGDDLLNGDAGEDILFGGADNDILGGGADDDSLDGGIGNDSLYGGDGDDTMVAGAGDDRFFGQGGAADLVSYFGSSDGVTVNLAVAGFQNVSAPQGLDLLGGVENLTGSEFDDTLFGDMLANRIEGAGGNDRITGGAGNDTMLGGFGIDDLSYFNATGGVTVDLSNQGVAQNVGGGQGIDTFNFFENLLGSGSFGDTLTGDGNANLIVGYGGDDSIVAGGGDDTVNGGAGADTIRGGDADDLIVGFDGLDWLYGDDGGDTIFGGAGNDRMFGQVGDDVLDGGAGDDILNGSTGIDTADYSTASDNLGINLNIAGFQSVSASQGIDQLIDIENVNGGSGDDVIFGNAAANDLQGGLGQDRLSGGGGNDTMDGGSGAVVDFLNYYFAGGVTVDLGNQGVAQGIGGGQGIDTFTNMEGVLGSNTGNDSLQGDAGDNTFQGYGGDDTIDGGAGNDYIVGGGGGDVLRGDGDDDTILGDDGNDLIGGGDGADVLAGGAGADSVYGGAGEDRVNGGVGADLLFGGGDADTFVYTDTAQSTLAFRDNIADFAGADVVDVSAIDANTNFGGNQVFTYIGGAGFTAAGQLRFIDNGVNGFILGDTDGDGAADLNIQVDGVLAMSAGDFIL